MNHGWEYRKLCDVTPAKSFDGEIEPCENKYWCLNLDKIESDTGRIIEYDYLESKDLHGSILKFSKNNVLFSKLRPNLNKVVVPMKDGFCTTELVPLCPIKDLIFSFILSQKSKVCKALSRYDRWCKNAACKNESFLGL